MAQKREIGILVRLPLASGLLAGKISREKQFAADDHRTYNRYGERFDQRTVSLDLLFERGSQHDRVLSIAVRGFGPWESEIYAALRLV